MNRIPRRRFLGASALLATSSLLPDRRAARASEPIRRTGPSRFKLSIAAYSYRRHLTGDSPSMDLFDFVDVAAKLGLDAVEPTTYYMPQSVDNEYLHRLKRHAFLQGLDISGTAIGNDFCLPDGPERDRQLERARTWIDRAAALDAPVVRFFAGRVHGDDTEARAVERAIEGFHAVLPRAAERGVMIALENHGGITATAEQMLRIVEAIDSPWFGVNFDSGNFQTSDPYAELEAIAPYAINAQLKTEISRGGRKEPANMKRIINILKDANYSGYLVIEYEAEEDPLEAVPGVVEELRALTA